MWEVEIPNVYLILFNLFTVEADQELEKSASARGLSDEDIKNVKPSEIIETLEKGFNAIATVLTDGVDT